MTQTHPNPVARGARHALWFVASTGVMLAAAACNRGPAPEAPIADVSPAVTATLASAGDAITPTERAETDLVGNARQLVLQGKRSGEGYFSADGKQLIFQSEREADNPFYQIYVLDLGSGKTERVSPGYGKTTCGWLAPDGTHALFASTHDEPSARDEMQAELDFRASGEQRRYSWDYDEAYEIYSVTRGKDDYQNLTNALGYDAEGAYSPDGARIVFASNRLAYSAPMTDTERAIFERDASYMMDIYVMDADGGNVTRVTEEPGYDGGPFFSPDGERIVWRHFNEEGTLAEIWTMRTDGTDKQQITAFGAMSWAPYYHPSGDYIIFTSSKLGFDNFELYMVDAAGAQEPVRVTFTAGADVLPVLSPDGESLVWSTTRNQAGGGSQLWIADWDDARARELLALSGPRGAGEVERVGTGMAVPPDMAATVADITAADAKLHVERLAAPEMNGRQTGTDGELLATAYVADAFDAIGLAPAGDDGYFQSFDFTSGVSLDGVNMLAVTTPSGDELEPVLDTDWRPLSFSKVGSAGFGEAVFAGYGIMARADSDQPAYDSYEGLDVAGKWVVVLRFLPEDVTPERRQFLNRYASLRFKAMAARDKGAAGLLVVSGPASQVKEELVPMRFDASVAGTSITAASVTDEFVAPWFEAAGTTLADAQAALDGGEAVPGFPLTGFQVGAHFTLAFDTDIGRNVLGRLQWGAEPSDEIVMIGAHVDHLGHGGAGDSLARPEEQGQIHYGADDNASGVAGLIEIAQQLASVKASGAMPAGARDVVFAAWSGEELGLLGSSHFVKAFGDDPKAESIYPAMSAYLNMDMIGRMRDGVILQGVGSSPGWAAIIEQRNVAIGLPVTLSDDTYLPTDATSFYLKGVPILAVFTGAHSEYHSPRDTPDLLDYDALAKIARLMGQVTLSLAESDEPLAYVKAQAPEQRGSNSGLRVYLGTIPDYADTSTAGVLLSGVADGGPAAEAGMLSGDVIVELAGQKLENIYDYTAALDGLKVGEPVSVVVMREGVRVELTVTPGSRQ